MKIRPRIMMSRATLPQKFSLDAHDMNMKMLLSKILPSALLAMALLPALSSCSSAPSLPAACHAKPESGRCKASILRYWYDDRAGTCKAFIWGGCGGSVPFENMEDCHAQCMPGQPLPEQPSAASAAAPVRSPATAPAATTTAPAK